jgi:hypothetical protein
LLKRACLLLSDYRLTVRKIDIRPDDRIFTPTGVGALNIGPVGCLAELVANSLDWSRLSGPERDNLVALRQKKDRTVDEVLRFYGRLLDLDPVDPEVNITIGKNRIEVVDNGIGMTVEDIQTALRLRGADDSKRPPLRRRKGTFGMGLKVGVLGLGWKVTLVTRSVFEANKEHRLTINSRLIEEKKIELKSIEVETTEFDRSGPLKNGTSGTAIIVEDLHRKEHNPVDISMLLGRSFSPDIEFGHANIFVVDATVSPAKKLDKCAPEVLPLVPDTRIDLSKENLEVRPDYGDGRRGPPLKIRGWIGLRTVSSSGRGDWGLHTFRMNQLVEPFHHDGPYADGLLPKNPHPMDARLHGEIHLDMCDPNFTKVGWNTERQSWREAAAKLAPYLRRMMEASEAFRKSSHGAEAVDMIQKVRANGAKTIAKLAAGDGTDSLSGDSAAGKLDAGVESREVLRLRDGTRLRIAITPQAFQENDQTERFWRYSYRDESNEMAVFVNISSSLWADAVASRDRDKMSQMVTNWAILDSLYFCLVNNMGYDADEARSLREEWIGCVYPEVKPGKGQ